MWPKSELETRFQAKATKPQGEGIDPPGASFVRGQVRDGHGLACSVPGNPGLLEVLKQLVAANAAAKAQNLVDLVALMDEILAHFREWPRPCGLQLHYPPE
jgi:hypothetical protein